jgi:hypothetical protein
VPTMNIKGLWFRPLSLFCYLQLLILRGIKISTLISSDAALPLDLSASDLKNNHAGCRNLPQLSD